MNREKRLVSRGRIEAFTRKQELAELKRRKDLQLADEIAKRIEPLIEAEVAKQLERALEDRGIAQ